MLQRKMSDETGAHLSARQKLSSRMYADDTDLNGVHQVRILRGIRRER